jgi:hypothetical protein
MLPRALTYALTCTLLIGCTSTTEIVPTGEHTYQVTYNVGAKWQTWVEVKNIAREQAIAHCASKGLRLVDPKVTSNHAAGLVAKEATINFRCAPIPAELATQPAPSL